jgi:hypothetical protein
VRPEGRETTASSSLVDQVLWFVDRILADMVAVVEELGDDLANLRTDVDGANTPFAILHHCLGVLEYWGGAAVAGRPVVRDREAEFVARGSVADLVARVPAARARLAVDLADVRPDDPPRRPPRGRDLDRPQGRTQVGVLLHLVEELAQHLGQMQGARDVLLAPWGRSRQVAEVPPPAEAGSDPVGP